MGWLNDNGITNYCPNIEGDAKTVDQQGSNAMIGYIPALFYSNFFTLYFLEMKDRTQKGAY